MSGVFGTLMLHPNLNHNTVCVLGCSEHIPASMTTKITNLSKMKPVIKRKTQLFYARFTRISLNFTKTEVQQFRDRE